MAGKPLEVFISYAPNDADLQKELVAHLAVLQRQGVIRAWHAGMIVPGAERDDVTVRHLDAADIVLLLISASFLACDDCYDREMKSALVRHTRGEARVIPIIVRPCHWTDAPFASLQALPPAQRA